MTIQEAREKARNEGFVEFGQEMSVEKIVLKSSFWESLAKAMKWGKKEKNLYCVQCGYTGSDMSEFEIENPNFCSKDGSRIDVKEEIVNMNGVPQWNGLMYHLQGGGTIEEYFERL